VNYLGKVAPTDTPRNLTMLYLELLRAGGPPALAGQFVAVWTETAGPGLWARLAGRVN